AFSSDGALVLLCTRGTGAAPATVQLHDLRGARAAGSYRVELHSAERIVAAGFGRSERWVVVLTSKGQLRLFDRESGKPLHSFKVNLSKIQEAILFDRGQKILLRLESGASALFNLGLATAWQELLPEVEAARTQLQQDARNATALTTLGKWYALHGRWDWAISLLEEAEKNGGGDLLVLAQSYWGRDSFAHQDRT